jgi:uncharacterized OB-fold protein
VSLQEVLDTVYRVPPLLTAANREFWLGGEHDQLLIPRCESCRQWFLAPTLVCPHCLSRDVRGMPASGRGTVAAFTIARHPWRPGALVPYVIAIIELAEQPGLRVISNVINCPVDAVRTGMPVSVRFAQLDDVWLPLFQPAEQDEETSRLPGEERKCQRQKR